MAIEYKYVMKKIGVHPLFLLLGAGFVLMGWGLAFVTYFFVVVIHELAHYLVAKKLGYTMDKIYLLPYGAGISLNQNFVDKHDEVIIAAAGPLCNFLLAFLTISLWWIFPETYNATEIFVLANLVTGLVNLLPCYPLDGGRIFSALLYKKIKNTKKILKISSFINFFIVFLLIFIFLTDIFNYFTFLIMAIFIFLGHFEGRMQGKYELTNFPLFLSKQKRGRGEINFIGVSENTEIFKVARLLKKNKFNLVYVFFDSGKIKILNERQLELLFQAYPSGTRFENVFQLTIDN